MATLASSWSPANGAGASPAATVETASITNIAQLLVLDPAARKQRLPVRIRAVVTYADLPWHHLYLEDETGAVFQPLAEPTAEPRPGDDVELRALTTESGPAGTVVQPELRVLGRARLPPAITATDADLLSGRLSAHWVAAVGLVRMAVRDEDRARVDLLTGATRLVCYLREIPPPGYDLDALLGATVRIEGVCANRYEGDRVVGAGLFLPTITNISLVAPPPHPRATAPVASIGNVLQTKTDPSNTSWVRIQGTVGGKQAPAAHRPGSALLHDSTGTIVVRLREQLPFKVNDRLDVWGFPTASPGGVVLEDATYALLPSARTSIPDGTPPTTLERIADIRALSREMATRRLPVHLQGTVTCPNPAWKSLFLQDETGSLYVRGWCEGLHTGTQVTVDGVTYPGGVSRMVVDATVRPTGATNLPTPLRIDPKALLSDRYDCAWVEVEGVVRSMMTQPRDVRLKIATGTDRFDTLVWSDPGTPPPQTLVNAHVRVRGANALVLNSRDQWTGFELRVPNIEAIEVVAPAPSDPFDILPTPIGTVRQSSVTLLGLQRIRIRGTVTLVSADGDLCVQDHTGALRILGPTDASPSVGDGVDVVGFPVAGAFATALEDVRIRAEPSNILVTPTIVSGRQALDAGRWDQTLIRIEGRVLEDGGGPTDLPLLVRDGDVVFQAKTDRRPTATAPSPLWRSGSLVRLTGVCHVPWDEGREPHSFVLTLRSPSDVILLQQPPWWTTRHLTALAAGIATTVLAVLGWVALLRHQVWEKTRQVRRQIESEATLKHRLALVWEIAADGMRMTDPQGIVVQANNAYCRLIGLPRSSLEGQPFTIAYQADRRHDLLASYHQRFVEREAARHYELEITLWNGRHAVFEVAESFFVLPDSPGLLLSQWREITERRKGEEERSRLQAQLLQAQKMESIGRLAGGVAHDYNNMLHAILGSAGFALTQIPADHPVAVELQEISRAAERSAALTRQLLAFARKQPIAPRVLDLNDAVSGMLRMLQRLIRKEVALAWIPGPNLWPIRIDPTQLDQILANLVLNAADAIVGNGQITIETINQPRARTTESTSVDAGSASSDAVALVVRDTGRGMEPEVLEHAFEPFFTTKPVGQGTGLGLASVYGIVQQNGGRVDITSQPGSGTTFRIHLPRAEISNAGGPISLPPSPSPTNG